MEYLANTTCEEQYNLLDNVRCTQEDGAIAQAIAQSMFAADKLECDQLSSDHTLAMVMSQGRSPSPSRGRAADRLECDQLSSDHALAMAMSQGRSPSPSPRRGRGRGRGKGKAKARSRSRNRTSSLDPNLGVGTTCSICLSDMERTENRCMLGCEHVFHDRCIKKWLKVKKTCPVCKCDVRGTTVVKG